MQGINNIRHSWLSALFAPESRACTFTVWAPLKESMHVRILNPDRTVAMTKDSRGYFAVTVSEVSSDSQYFFSPDGDEQIPDPASNFQPHGVHGCSQVVDHEFFQWSDSPWRGLAFRDLVLYELHVGTFSREGTFEAIIPRLTDLRDCGINAIQLMPVSQFAGSRNWGYDGAFPYATQNSYGGPHALKKFVNACHEYGIAVILDVVYNHLGPEGNYLGRFAPYFTDQYCTPWGDAINFDREWSDGVRDYFTNNALYWFEYFHIDGLRLDAIHMVFDQGAVHIWQHLQEKVQELSERCGKPFYLIAESDLNTPKVVSPAPVGGYGFTAQWLDDFHHAIYVKLDPKGAKRYEDFGSMTQVAKAYKEGFVHSGEYVKFRKKKHGISSAGVPGDRFIVFTSNHDQIGNRPDGGRLTTLIDFERLKIAAAALILAPYVPMLFMGEEYGEVNPFYYFISHSDQELIDAVRKGRKEEFKAFKTDDEWADPYDEDTFNRSVLNWELRRTGRHVKLCKWYQTLIKLRRESPSLRNFRKNDVDAIPIGESVLLLGRRDEDEAEQLVCIFNLSEKVTDCVLPFPGTFNKILDSGDSAWLNDEYADTAASKVAPGQTLRIPALHVSLYRRVSA